MKVIACCAAIGCSVGVLAQTTYCPPDSKVLCYHGSPAIMIDGKPLPPMSVTLRDDALDHTSAKSYLERLGRAGIRLFYVYAKTRWLQPGDPARGVPDGVTEVLGYLRTVREAVPDAYVMLRLNVSPSVAWVNAHPEEQVLYSDGTHRKTLCTSVSFTEPVDGMHSLCSERWREEGARAVEAFLDELSHHPEFARVIGCFLCAGGTAEWYYPGVVATGERMELSDGACADCSEPFRREFERYLRGKYKTVEALRRAWRRPDATFAHPIIPTSAERAYTFRAEKEMMADANDYRAEDPARLGFSTDLNDPKTCRLGVFLNAVAHRHVADFYAALHESTARTVVHFARTLKRINPNMLVGAFYGAYGCQDYFDSSTTTGTLTILDSGVVDFLAAPGVYNNREPGGVVAQREMQDSFRIRDKMYICEDDARTHLLAQWASRSSMGLFTAQDSVDTLKRDFARNICEDLHGWWFDMGESPEIGFNRYWYDDPDILALFAEQQRIAKLAYSLDRTKRNEIALVYDTESVHYLSQRLGEVVLDFYRTTDLGRIGAPVDYYFHNDLSDARMPDYKLYVMLNQYCLTDAEREAVYAKARRNGAVVLWMYAPGFFNADAADPLSADNVSRTVGMNVRISDKTFAPKFRLVPGEHPIVRGASLTRQYGVLDRDLHSNLGAGNHRFYPFLNPGFHVEDDRATVLGRYCHNGKAALATVETNGVKSVYCATPVVRSDLLASIAAYAGCHLYSKKDDVLYANENFVAVHAKDDGRRTIRFKRKCSPYEVYERRYFGHDVDSIEVDMRLGQTLMWSLNGASGSLE